MKGQKRVGFWRWCKKENKRRAEEEEKEERKGYMYFEWENQESKGGIREGYEIQLSVSPGYAKFGSGKCVLRRHPKQRRKYKGWPMEKDIAGNG